MISKLAERRCDVLTNLHDIDDFIFDEDDEAHVSER